MYDSSDYASNRLNGTVVRDIEGQAVMVDSCRSRRGGNISAEVYYIRTGDYVEVDLSELNLEPVSLGFVNSTSGLIYAARMPMRSDWRQGLRNNNFTILYGRALRRVDVRELVTAIENIYPSLEMCIDEAVNSGISMAFSRDFAVRDDKVLIYKWMGGVGYINDDNEPILNNDNQHLEPLLRGALNENR